MKLFSPDQIFDIIGSVTCQTDLIEIEHFVLTNQTSYPGYLVDIWELCINDLYSVLK